MQPRKEADIGKNLTVSKVFVYIKSTQKGLQQIRFVFDLDLGLGSVVEGELDHPKVVAHHGLGPVVDEAGPEEGEVALVMIGEMFVEKLGGYQLEDSVAKKLHPLIATKGEVVEPNGSVREGSGQESDVIELYSRHILKLDKFLKDRVSLYPVSVPARLLSLKRMR